VHGKGKKTLQGKKTFACKALNIASFCGKTFDKNPFAQNHFVKKPCDVIISLQRFEWNLFPSAKKLFKGLR